MRTALQQRKHDEYIRNREHRLAYQSRYYEENMDHIKEYDRVRYKHDARTRARVFLNNCPDCTSTLEEVEAIYDAGVNALTGEVQGVGNHAGGLVLDHIHEGPAIGLVPRSLNPVLEVIDENRDEILAYLDRRRQML